jgi:translation initiation factor IF-2
MSEALQQADLPTLSSKKVFAYDIETLKSYFSAAFIDVDTEERFLFEVFEVTGYKVNNIKRLFDFLDKCKGLVGYNNLYFDYPVIHHLMENKSFVLKMSISELIEFIYVEAQRLIDRQSKFKYKVPDDKVKIPQLDLMVMNYFNSKARFVSLKQMEFVMRYENVQDMPYNHRFIIKNRKQAKEIAEKRQLAKTETSRQSSNANSIEALNEKLSAGDMQAINLIIKTDNTGSLEAIKSSLEKLTAEGVKLKIIRSDIGSITETDLMLALSSKALIYSFNIKPESSIQQKANELKVDIRLHRIIYALLEEVEAMMKGKIKIKMIEKVLGQFEIRQIFKLTKAGVVAGGMVTTGMMMNQAMIRLLRNGAIVHEGKISSLKRMKDEVKEVKTGFECGVAIENYHEMKVGDIIEAFQMVEEKK